MTTVFTEQYRHNKQISIGFIPVWPTDALVGNCFEHAAVTLTLDSPSASCPPESESDYSSSDKSSWSSVAALTLATDVNRVYSKWGVQPNCGVQNQKLWSPRLKNVDSRRIILHQEISYFEPKLFSFNKFFTHCYSTVPADSGKIVQLWKEAWNWYGYAFGTILKKQVMQLKIQDSGHFQAVSSVDNWIYHILQLNHSDCYPIGVILISNYTF